MIDYTLLKSIHVACVVLSGAGFALRGALALARSPLLERRWVRVAPHLVDTVLLASALWMAWLAQLSPLAHPWIGAKVGLLVVYIVLGSIALRRARTPRGRALAYAAALATFALMVAIALTRSPLPGIIR